MHAAVVSDYTTPPSYQVFADPTSSDGQTVVEVLASGLHPRVRSQADGSHYTSTEELPLIPGIDGVGRRADGRLVYFVLPTTRFGAMAERVTIEPGQSVELPDDADPVLLAAAMNPAMSSWLALRHRIDFIPGQSVLVLGATGNAGRIAVQVARRLGAARVVGAGRIGGRTDSSVPDADELVDLLGPAEKVARDLAAAASTVDVVIDYLWGQPTTDALRAIIPARADDTQQLSWIQVGSVTGPDSLIPSAALRATRLQIVGSGQGSITTGQILAELPALAAEIGTGVFDIAARAVPLRQVEHAWRDAATITDRLVLIP